MIFKCIPAFDKLTDPASYLAKSMDKINEYIVKLVSLLFIYVINPYLLFNYLFPQSLVFTHARVSILVSLFLHHVYIMYVLMIIVLFMHTIDINFSEAE